MRICIVLSSFLATFRLFTPCVAQHTHTCTTPAISGLSCLEDHARLQTICAAATRTKTSTTSTTVISWVTNRASEHVASQATINLTHSESTRTTVTTCVSAPAITAFHTTTVWNTATTYTPASSATRSSRRRRQDYGEVCDGDSVEMSFSKLATSVFDSACSCSGYHVATVTMTSTATFASPMTTTIYDGLAPTTTINYITKVTVTETITKLDVATSFGTISRTATTTISLSAPTYTQVLEPQRGCEMVAAGLAQELDANAVRNLQHASDVCKDTCDQLPICAHVFVQAPCAAASTDIGGFQCIYLDHHLDIEADLQCGLASDKEVVGFDAYGRGNL